MMENGVAPDSVEVAVGEGQTFAVHLQKIDGDAVGPCPLAGLVEVAGGEVEGSHLSAMSGQDDPRHAVPAAVIQDAQATNVAELCEGGTNPGFVVEVDGIV